VFSFVVGFEFLKSGEKFILELSIGLITDKFDDFVNHIVGAPLFSELFQELWQRDKGGDFDG
jgi:hypothetical protein